MFVFFRLRLDQISRQVKAVESKELELHAQTVMQGVYTTFGGPPIDIHSRPVPVAKTITSFRPAVATVHLLIHSLLQVGLAR